jgi:hypothetical protein
MDKISDCVIAWYVSSERFRFSYSKDEWTELVYNMLVENKTIQELWDCLKLEAKATQKDLDEIDINNNPKDLFVKAYGLSLDVYLKEGISLCHK